MYKAILLTVISDLLGPTRVSLPNRGGWFKGEMFPTSVSVGPVRAVGKLVGQ
jgi:hypothetical protein